MKKVLSKFPDYMHKSLEEACLPATFQEMGMSAATMGENDSEEWTAVQEHARFSLRFLKHTNRFLTYQKHAPWVCEAFVDIDGPHERAMAQRILEEMRIEWETVLAAEAKHDGWLNSCTHLKWQCYRELMTCAEEGNWELSPDLIALAEAWFPKRSNTVTLEHTFNKMRDAEQRHSKHTRASASQLAAVAIKATNNLLGPRQNPDSCDEPIDLVEPPQSLMASLPKEFSNGYMKRDVFECSRIALSSGGIPNVSEIFRTSNRTSAFAFVAKGLTELDARIHLKKKQWQTTSYLWVAAVIPECSVAQLKYVLDMCSIHWKEIEIKVTGWLFRFVELNLFQRLPTFGDS